MMSLNAKLVVFLMAVLPIFSIGAQAMTIEDFGRLNDDDEAGYVAFLIEASAHMLKAQGRPDQAAETIAYFKQPGKDGGVQQLAEHLESINAVNKRNAINPNNRVAPLQVEDALESTLKQKGIMIPAKDLIAAGKSFRPEGLPRQHILGN